MNFIPNLFDKYERNARLYPAVIVLIPAIIAAGFTLPSVEGGWSKYAIVGGILLAVAYVLMQVVRHLGRSVEPSLWQVWGGPPSTRFLLWRDGQFSDEWKTIAHAIVESALSITLLSREDETNDSERAQKLISDAFSQVRAVLNLEKPEAEHRIHNIEYGFSRNLLGSCVLGGTVAAFSIVWCIYFAFREHNEWAWVGAALCFGLLIAFLGAKVRWLPSVCKLAADRYAEKAWAAFIELKREKKKESKDA